MKLKHKSMYTAIYCIAVCTQFIGAESARATGIGILPKPILNYCPNHTNGDKEFAGHGPAVFAEARASISEDGTGIDALVSIFAKETKEDWSTAQGVTKRRIFNAPNGHIITDILSDTSSQAIYTDSNHVPDFPPVSGGLVNAFEIMGDTRGDDIGACNRDRVYMDVFFNGMEINIEPLELSENIITLNPRDLTMLCPIPTLRSGDNEFDGNGPTIVVNASIFPGPNNETIRVKLDLGAIETTPNWSHAFIEIEEIIARVPPGVVIERILSADNARSVYTDTDHTYDYPFVQGALVDQVEIMGDTRGDDIGVCTGNHTHMNVAFNPIRVLVK